MNVSYELHGPGSSDEMDEQLDRAQLATDVLALLRKHVVDFFDVQIGAKAISRLISEYVAVLAGILMCRKYPLFSKFLSELTDSQRKDFIE